MGFADSMKRFARQRMALQTEVYGQPITWRGVTQVLVLSDVSERRQLDDGGFMLEHAATLRIPMADGAAKPTLGEKITRVRTGRQMRIDEVIDDPAGLEWVVGLSNL